MASVKETVKAAYGENSENYDDRELIFLAPKTVSFDWAEEVMKEATPKGYNNFIPQNIDLIATQFSGDARVILAREYSVCMYVVGTLTGSEEFLRNNMAVDEFFSYSMEEFKESIEEQDVTGSMSPQLREELEERENQTVYRLWWD